MADDIKGFEATYQKRHGANYWSNVGLIIAGAALSAGIAITGLLQHYVAAAILGALASSVFAVSAAFALGEKAEFQRIITMEAGNLIRDIKFGPSTDTDFDRIRAGFAALRRQADTSLPRGSGMEAVRRMYEDIRTAQNQI